MTKMMMMTTMSITMRAGFPDPNDDDDDDGLKFIRNVSR